MIHLPKFTYTYEVFVYSLSQASPSIAHPISFFSNSPCPPSFPNPETLESRERAERLKSLAEMTFASSDIKSQIISHMGRSRFIGRLAVVNEEWNKVALTYPPFGTLHLIANVDRYLTL